MNITCPGLDWERMGREGAKLYKERLLTMEKGRKLNEKAKIEN
jgi:hypothetical protein